MNNVWQKHLTGWGKRHPTDTNPLKPPRPVQTSSPLGSSSAKAAGKIPLSVTAHSPVVYDAQTGRRHLPTPPGSTGVRTMTPSRGESGLTAQTGMAMSVVGDISTAGAITPHQKQRQQQLEALLSLPSRFARVGGGYERVPYAADELLNAAVVAVTRERGYGGMTIDDDKAKLCDALGFAIAEADELRAALGEQPVLEQMRQRVQQAQVDAARHEEGLESVRLEATAARKAASEVQSIQADLVQVQRQLASWVLTAVEHSRAQRKAADPKSPSRPTQLSNTAPSDSEMSGAVIQMRGAIISDSELLGETSPGSTHEGSSSVQASPGPTSVQQQQQAQYTESLLESLAYFYASRAQLKQLVTGMRAWQACAALHRRDQAAVRFAEMLIVSDGPTDDH